MDIPKSQVRCFSPQDWRMLTAFMKELHTRVYELEAEMENHLGYEKHSNQGDSDNSRNGSYRKQIQTEMGESVI